MNTVRTADSPRVSLRAEMSGIGSLLSSLRENVKHAEHVPSTTECASVSKIGSSGNDLYDIPFEEDGSRPLNRKERRALLKLSESENCAFSEKPSSLLPEKPVCLAAVPSNLRLSYWDYSSYDNYNASFGYEESRKNNYVHMVFQNETSTFTVTGAQDRCIRAYKMNQETISCAWKRNTGGLIMDLCWDQLSGNIFSTCKYRPIQLWDVNTGELLKSYNGKDSGDNVKEALSIGQIKNSLLGGFKKHFQIWDVETGGDAYSSIRYYDKDYNTGIVGHAMSICNNPTMSELFAAAGTSARVCIYSMNWKSAVTTMEGSARGYTHVKFSIDGTKLYASERSGDIHCFDTRMNMLTQILKREMKTAHRTRFEIDESGRFLFSGTSSGDVVIYDLHKFEEELDPVLSLNIGPSCVPCASIKNNKLAVCTGQRSFHRFADSEEDEDDGKQKKQFFKNSLQIFEVV